MDVPSGGHPILTGLEIDSAKSGVKPDLSQYLGENRGRKSLFLRYKTIRQKSDSRKGDSEDMRYLMRGIDKEGNYKETLIRRCHQILRPYAGAYDEAAKCAIALGKRQFALEVFPSTVLDPALDIFKEEKPRKRKWRWPWDAERD